MPLVSGECRVLYQAGHGFALLPLLFGCNPPFSPRNPLPHANLVLELKDDRRRLNVESPAFSKMGTTSIDDLLRRNPLAASYAPCRLPTAPGKPDRPDFSRIRHDLRTPVNHIIGYCEMLLEDESVPTEFRADLEKIHAGGRRLLSLIRDYFDEESFAQKRPGLHQLHHELRTPVNHIVGYTELLEELAEERGLPLLSCRPGER